MLLVSAVPGTESAICAYVSPASWTSLLPPPTLHATHLGHHRAPVLTGFPLAIYLTRGSVCVCVCVCVCICPNLPFPLCVHASFLHLCLSSPALQMGSVAPFFYISHAYALICRFAFLFLTDFTPYDGFWVHPHLYKWPSFIPFYGRVMW